MKNLFILSMIVIVSYFISCSQKNNYMGYDQDPDIQSYTISNAITLERSFADTIGIYPSNPLMLVGNFNDVKTRSLLQFSSLHDTTWIDSTSIESCQIFFKRKSQMNQEIPITIHAYKLLKSWSVSSTTWDSISTEDYEDFPTPIEFIINTDSICIDFPFDIVEDWINDDSLNYGILLDASDAIDNFVELYTHNTNDDGPLLKIIAIGNETGKKDTLNFRANKDMFIGFDENMNRNYDPGKMIIANLPPSQLIIKVNVDSVCTQLGTTLDKFKKYSINLANVQFDSTMIQNSFIDDYISILPYYVSDIQSNENMYIPTTSISYFMEDDSLSIITVTAIFEGIIREDLSNPYIALVSKQENKDYSFIEFFENSKPTFHIIYTKPILEK